MGHLLLIPRQVNIRMKIPTTLFASIFLVIALCNQILAQCNSGIPGYQGPIDTSGNPFRKLLMWIIYINELRNFLSTLSNSLIFTLQSKHSAIRDQTWAWNYWRRRPFWRTEDTCKKNSSLKVRPLILDMVPAARPEIVHEVIWTVSKIKKV